MENSSQAPPQSKEEVKCVILRWGHRPQRDVRLTTHVALTARALCASGFILSDVSDPSIEKTVMKVTRNWGGKFFFEMGTPWKTAVQNWKANGGIVVHLTVYGENVQSSDVLNRIRKQKRNLLILVGSQKVPGEFYSSEVSDFNMSIGNQPHSECAALAIFLDRFFEGEELTKTFAKAKIGVIPQERGKKTVVDDDYNSEKQEEFY